MGPTEHSTTATQGPSQHESNETPLTPDNHAGFVNIPQEEQPNARCPHCGRPFPRDHLRTLHVGEAHPGEWTDGEREAYTEAREDESADLFVYHVKVVFALSVTYTLMVLAYMVVLTYGG